MTSVKAVEPNPVLISFSRVAENEQFHRVGPVWIRDRGVVLDVLELQRSNHGRYYYINVGVFLKEAEAPKRIRYTADCHLDVRAESLVPHDLKLRLIRATDLEVDLSQDSRLGTIAEAVHEYVLPFFDKYSTGQAILELANTPHSRRSGTGISVWWPLLEYAGHPKRIPSDNDFDPEWIP